MRSMTKDEIETVFEAMRAAANSRAAYLGESGTPVGGPPFGAGLISEWMCRNCQGLKYGDSQTVEPPCRCEKDWN